VIVEFAAARRLPLRGQQARVSLIQHGQSQAQKQTVTGTFWTQGLDGVGLYKGKGWRAVDDEVVVVACVFASEDNVGDCVDSGTYTNAATTATTDGATAHTAADKAEEAGTTTTAIQEDEDEDDNARTTTAATATAHSTTATATTSSNSHASTSLEGHATAEIGASIGTTAPAC